jgi:hypothetical protein
MSYYTHHMHTDTGHYVHIDVPLCHTCDVVPYDTQHKYTDGPQHIHPDIHSEDSVKKKNFVKITNIKFQ